MGESIGKILFGDCFECSYLSENQRDLEVALSSNYYIVFDNLDSGVRGAYLNDLCTAATGGVVKTRKLYTDRDEVTTKPRIFIVVTTREPKFKRDDFVDRLLLFNTEKVKNPKSRNFLLNELKKNRNNIWAEFLINLNSIVKLLKQKSEWNLPCILRIADWELLSRKIHSQESVKNFVGILRKMIREKSKFSLEDDPLYILLRNIIYERGEVICEEPAATLYSRLKDEAEHLKLQKEFERKYKSSISLGKKLKNLEEELSFDFDFTIDKSSRGRTNLYTINKKVNVPERDEVNGPNDMDVYEAEERAAIMEINGGMPREEAEKEALRHIEKGKMVRW